MLAKSGPAARRGALVGTCPTGAFIMKMNADNNATVASKTVNELTLEDLEVVDIVLVLHASRRKLGVENARGG